MYFKSVNQAKKQINSTSHSLHTIHQFGKMRNLNHTHVRDCLCSKPQRSTKMGRRRINAYRQKRLKQKEIRSNVVISIWFFPQAQVGMRNFWIYKREKKGTKNRAFDYVLLIYYVVLIVYYYHMSVVDFVQVHRRVFSGGLSNFNPWAATERRVAWVSLMLGKHLSQLLFLPLSARQV